MSHMKILFPLHIIKNGEISETDIAKPIDLLTPQEIAYLTADDQFLGGYLEVAVLNLLPSLLVYRTDVEYTAAARMQFQDLALPASRQVWDPVENHAQFEFLMRIVRKVNETIDIDNSAQFRKEQLLTLLRNQNGNDTNVNILSFHR